MRDPFPGHKVKGHLFDAWCNTIAASPIWPAAVRRSLYRLGGIRLGDQTILAQCTFTGNRIEMGAGSWVNRRAFFECAEMEIRIGANCGIGMDALFVTGSHAIQGPAKRAGANFYQPIVVQDGVWIGARATILPGVTIGAGCVIAAGAVVTRSCEANGLYAGVPARRIRELPTTTTD